MTYRNLNILRWVLVAVAVALAIGSQVVDGFASFKTVIWIDIVLLVVIGTLSDYLAKMKKNAGTTKKEK